MYLKNLRKPLLNVLVKFFSLSTFCDFFTVHHILSQIFLFCLKYRLYTGGKISVFCNLKKSTGKKMAQRNGKSMSPIVLYSINRESSVPERRETSSDPI